ncbi:MAG: cation:proton antiporter regulatory subunit [Halobacteriota archaeon]
MIVLQAVDEVLELGGRIVGLAVLALLISLVASLVYRWHVDEELPQGVGLLLGASAVAIALNTTAALGQSLGGTTELLTARAASFTILAFSVSGVASEAGRLGGDRLGRRLPPGRGLRDLDGEVTSFIQGAGRTIRVDLEAEIQDIDGFEPVRPDLKEDLAGRTMTFPGRLTVDELHEAFETRLQSEIGIRKVDVEIDEAGAITYLAVGRGAAGIGHTIPPGEVALAIRADPAFAAGPGDQVRVWWTDPEPRQLLTAEIRSVVEDIVTVSVPEGDVSLLAPESGYRLVTLPKAPRPDRDFAGALRRANESVTRVTIDDGSDVVGRSVADIGVTALAIESMDGSIDAPPTATSRLQPGDTVIAMGRPDALRRFELVAQGTS